MENKAVSNTGPILHLNEINCINSLDIFSVIKIPEEVVKELKKRNVTIPKKIILFELNPNFKDHVKVLTNEYNLDLGEAEAISSAMQEKADYFLTDDSDARQIARFFNIEVHGTIGIILRSFREKRLDKKKAIEKITELKTKSSLFITQDLIKAALEGIEGFRD